jgi:hypothetical protein
MTTLAKDTRRNGLGRFNTRTFSFALISALGVGALSFGACSSSDDDEADPADAASNGATIDAASGGGADAMPSAPDAMQAVVQIPDWTLEDIQPESPKFGQVYGLSEFNGKILIAVLVEGF